MAITTLTSDLLRLDVGDAGQLTVIRAGGPIASGVLAIGDVSTLLGVTPDEGEFDLGLPQITLGEARPDRSCTLVLKYPHATAVCTLKIDGPDLQFTFLITNASPRIPLNIVRIQLPTVRFSRQATGTLHSWHDSYLSSVGTEILHPSSWNNISGVYAMDGASAVGCTTQSHLRKRSMFHLGWSHDLKDGEIPQIAPLQFVAEINLSPGDTAHVDLTLRFTDNQDWKYLLANYAQAWHDQLEAAQYLSDHRPWAQSVPADPQWVTPQNPLGFEKNGRAQLDWDAGTRRYVNERVIPLFGVCQGAILWNPQGYNPRGAWFRPDFDIFPKSVADNLPILHEGFEQHGLRMGLCARPIDMIWPLNPTTDVAVHLDPRDASQVNALLRRFTNAIKLGFDAFYLDSFGSTLQGAQLMRKIRRLLGEKVPTFSESSSDLILPYTALYTETAENGAVVNLGGPMQDIYRWLAPNIPIIAINRGKWPLESLYQKRITPLIELYQLSNLRDTLLALNAKYLDKSGQWK